MTPVGLSDAEKTVKAVFPIYVFRIVFTASHFKGRKPKLEGVSSDIFLKFGIKGFFSFSNKKNTFGFFTNKKVSFSETLSEC